MLVVTESTLIGWEACQPHLSHVVGGIKSGEYTTTLSIYRKKTEPCARLRRDLFAN